jgi:hypothetical protein
MSCDCGQHTDYRYVVVGVLYSQSGDVPDEEQQQEGRVLIRNRRTDADLAALTPAPHFQTQHQMPRLVHEIIDRVEETSGLKSPSASIAHFQTPASEHARVEVSQVII